MELSAPRLVQQIHNVPTLFKIDCSTGEMGEHGGPFSLKMVAAGVSTYRFGRQAVSVRPGQLLLVGAGERYATHQQGAAVVTLYLPSAVIDEALASFDAHDAMQADPTVRAALAFAPHIRTDGQGLIAAAARLADVGDTSTKDEALSWIALHSAELALQAAGATASIPASRTSVRRELFRRVCIARNRIEQAPEKPATLQELARLAALSRFHLLRTFTIAFGESPDQMRRRLAIDRAKVLLTDPAMSISDISTASGFESHAGFCRAFRRRCGLSPSQIRKEAGIGS